MIRERRREDLEPLRTVLESMDSSSGFLAGTDPGEWLEEHDAERSWVFDMAPVRVTPTRNVVGHVQMYRPTPRLLGAVDRPAGDLVAIGKLFVRPQTFEHGIGRFLLTQAVGHVRGRGKVPVLDRPAHDPFPTAFYEKLGFEEIASTVVGATAMVAPGEIGDRRG